MFLFGSAILYANNPLKDVSSEFVLLCKKAAPFHFIQATPQLVLSAFMLMRPASSGSSFNCRGAPLKFVKDCVINAVH